MVTALTYGRLYICDWIDDTSDSDNQDLENGTAGTNYFYIKDPHMIRGSKRQGGDDPIYYPDKGEGFFIRDGELSGQIIFQGYVYSRTELDYIDDYVVGHTDKDSFTDPDYLFIPKASNDWDTFRNDDGTRREFARGWLRDFKWVLEKSDSLRYRVILEFWVVWS